VYLQVPLASPDRTTPCPGRGWSLQYMAADASQLLMEVDSSAVELLTDQIAKQAAMPRQHHAVPRQHHAGWSRSCAVLSTGHAMSHQSFSCAGPPDMSYATPLPRHAALEQGRVHRRGCARSCTTTHLSRQKHAHMHTQTHADQLTMCLQTMTRP